ncbi:tape measure protein, partial [Clostridium perfringens]
MVGTDGLSGAISKTIPELSPLVDMLSNIGNLLRTIVIPSLFKLGLWCSQHINVIATLVITLGTLNLAIKSVFAIERIILFIQSFKKAILAIKEFEILTKLATAAQWLFNAALSANPIGLVIIGLVALIAGLAYLWNTSEGFRNFWINAWESIKNTCKVAVDGISKFFTDTIPNAFKSLINSAKSTKDFFVNGFEYLKNAVSNFGTLLVTKFKNWCDEVWILFTQTIPNWIQSIVDWFSELPHHIG